MSPRRIRLCSVEHLSGAPFKAQRKVEYTHRDGLDMSDSLLYGGPYNWGLAYATAWHVQTVRSNEPNNGGLEFIAYHP